MKVFRVELQATTTSVCTVEIDCADDDEAVVEQFALDLAETDPDLEWVDGETTVGVVDVTAVAELEEPA